METDDTVGRAAGPEAREDARRGAGIVPGARRGILGDLGEVA